MSNGQFSMWKKVLGAVAVLAAAGVVSVVALVAQYDVNELKPAFETMVEDATGREMTIAGDLELNLSLQPSLSVSGVTLSNAPWADTGDMLALDVLEAKIDLLGLLQGQVDVRYIVIDGLKIVLATDGKGRANWEFDFVGDADTQAPTQAGGLMFTPHVRDVRLLDVDVTYLDGATGKSVHFALNEATFKADALDVPMRATLAGDFNGVEVAAEVEMGSAALLMGREGGPFPVDMTLSAPGLSAQIKGTVDQPQAGMDVNAYVDVRVSDSAVLDRLAGTELPNLDGLTLRMAVAGAGARYNLSAIDARVGPSDLGGAVSIDLAGARPRVSGKIASKVLNLDDLLALDAPQADAAEPIDIPTSKPQGEAAKLFSTAPLALGGLGAVDADLDIRAARIQALNLTADSMSATLKLDGGKLRLKPFAVTVEDGQIGGELSLDASQEKPALAFNGHVIELDAGRVLAALGRGSMLQLPLTGKLDVTSRGGSVHELVRHMNGHARLAAEGGRFDDSAVRNLTTGVGQILPWAKHADGAVLSCVVADWPIENGVALAKTVIADTPGFTVAVTGNIDLGGELFHLTVIPTAKSTSLASFAVPVRLKGALSQPYVDLDPGDVVVGTVGNIVKAPAGLVADILGGLLPERDKSAEPNPCLKALNGAKTQPQQPKTTEQAPPPQGEGQGANPLGKVLDNIFGR